MILIPVKNQVNAKQRLSSLMTPHERFALAQAMLEDVLDAVAAIPRRPPVSLVTNDDFARSLAPRHGFGIIDDSQNAGETAAIEMATQACVASGAKWSFVIPGDAPFMTPEELGRMLDAAPPEGALLCPDHRKRGSNAVFRAPGGLFPLRFGDDSYAPHVACAGRTNLPVICLDPADFPGVALDLDRPDDVRAALDVKFSSGKTRTTRFLQLSRIGERIGAQAAGF